MSDGNKERNELINNAFNITKRASRIWDKVERYRAKLVYAIETDISELTTDDISELSCVLQEYSAILSNAVYEITEEHLPYISENIEKYFIGSDLHIKKEDK